MQSEGIYYYSLHFSVKGYDEVVPKLLNVVLESRKYRVPDESEGNFFEQHEHSRYHTCENYTESTSSKNG